MGGHWPPGENQSEERSSITCSIQNLRWSHRKCSQKGWKERWSSSVCHYCHCFTVLSVQPTLLQALHLAVLQGKGSEVPQLLQVPLGYLEQGLSRGKTPYLTGVCRSHVPSGFSASCLTLFLPGLSACTLKSSQPKVSSLFVLFVRGGGWGREGVGEGAGGGGHVSTWGSNSSPQCDYFWPGNIWWGHETPANTTNPRIHCCYIRLTGSTIN